MVISKDQLEKKMTEFFCGLRKIQDGSDYSSSSLVNAYNCLSNYFYKHLGGSQKFVINNKSEFPLLWEVLNGKMKVLKQSRKVTKHHNPLSSDKLKTIFNHKTLSINTAKGLQYQVLIWCCLLFAPRGGEHSQMKVMQFTFLSNGGIQFTKFSQKNDPSGIEGNLDSLIIPVPADPEGPSEQQKKDALSTLISVVDLQESQDNDDKPDNYDSSGSHVPPKSSVYSEFRSPLKNSTKPNLPSHINAIKKNQTLNEKRLLRPSQSSLQNTSNSEQGTTIINNYCADHITINQY
ncbi:1860_t:CDS:2 [Cetraspora pellucida]|uniref:1860_t:CDS:1 n=1 Tax=Cetraspora pellucida TaxID=1433469 RepID=A0ACA9LRI9_9GLOM|nr:1860_t:CDS:2 [Cetraspora pellucida]